MSGETSDKTNDEIKVLLKMYPYKEDGTIKIGNIKLQYENLNGSVSIDDQVDFYLRDLAKWLHWYANSNGSDNKPPEYLKTTVVPSSTIRYVKANRSESSSNDDNNNKLGGNTKYTKCLKKKSKKKREKTSKKKREKTSKKR